jgi:hypothetical protein
LFVATGLTVLICIGWVFRLRVLVLLDDLTIRITFLF